MCPLTAKDRIGAVLARLQSSLSLNRKSSYYPRIERVITPCTSYFEQTQRPCFVGSEALA